MKNKLIMLITICAIGLYSCTNSTDPIDEVHENYDTGIDDDIITHELEREKLLEKEQTNPSMFLILTGEIKKNLKGEWILKGSIDNQAQEATYNNIKLEAIYYDKQDSIVITSEEILNSTIAPKQSIMLKYKLSERPNKVKRVIVKVAL